MEERKAYFDLISKRTVLLTEDELIERGSSHYITLGKWDKFLYDNEDVIFNNVTRYQLELANVFYTVKSNTGAMLYNTYNTFEEAFTAAAANLYIEERSKNGNGNK